MYLVGPKGESIRLERHQDCLVGVFFCESIEGEGTSAMEGNDRYVPDRSVGC